MESWASIRTGAIKICRWRGGGDTDLDGPIPGDNLPGGNKSSIKKVLTSEFLKLIFVRIVLWWSGWTGRALFPSGAFGASSDPCINFLNEYNCNQITRVTAPSSPRSFDETSLKLCREKNYNLFKGTHCANIHKTW